MERELKIVLTVFLVYLLYGIHSLADTQTLITPVFLSSVIFVALAVFFAITNRKTPSAYVLVFCFFAFFFFALVDAFVIGLLNRFLAPSVIAFLSGNFFGYLAFFVFFGFLAFSIWFFYQQTRKRYITAVLASILSACIILFFTDYYLVQEICIQSFYVLYFIFGQQGSELKDKVLRIVSYQFLLVSLLESFEYFL